MSNLFPDKLWNYKNFNMGTELDIAGDFIYDGIHTLNQMDVINQDCIRRFRAFAKDCGSTF